MADDGEQEGGKPNPTIYVSNIAERIRGDKLRNGLKQVFTPYGKIRKLCMRKSLAMRGQAFVIFSKTEEAQNALEKAAGFNFYGQPLRLAFAHTPSDLTLKQQGAQPPKRPAHPRKGLVAVKLEKAAAKPAPAAVPVAQPYVPTSGPPPMYPYPNGATGPAAAGVTAAAPMPPPGVAPVVPHSVLFAEQLPQETTQESLSALFAPFPGFQAVRMIPGRACAFIDFGTDAEATAALNGLKGAKLAGDQPLKLSYARK